jgi:hypothetical protein
MPFPSFQVVPAFSVPMVLAQHPDPARLNAELKALFLKREAEGGKHANRQPLVQRNPMLFESNFQLFSWPDRPVAELRDYCLRQLYRAIGELNGYDEAMLRRLQMASESWFHITRKGGYFGMHNHALHSWSGVYCVDPGIDSSGVADSGQLSFLNPSATSTMFMDMAVARMSPPFNYGSRTFQFEAGQLVLFPSWLLHEVKPFWGEGERITVAFNARFRLEGAVRDEVPMG